MSSLCVHLANTQEEFTEGLNLIYRAGKRPGSDDPSGLGLMKQHALPSSNLVVARHEGRIVGAIMIFGENPFGLPLEERHNLEKLRSDLDGRLAELSAPGLAPGWEARPELASALLHFAVCFGSTYCRYDGFVTERNPGDNSPAQAGFRPVGSGSPGTVFWLESRLAPDYRKAIPAAVAVEYAFPPQKFFLVAHQNMTAGVMHHLFNERTQLFSRLSDAELRVLKSIYDCGEFSRVLPERAQSLSTERFPRFRRFPMNCDGFLCNPRGERVHLLVLDVSREGLKVKAEAPLKSGKVYPLTVTVGITKQSEIIASAVWADRDSLIAGLTLKSHDHNWEQLIDYLESDFLKTAA